MQKEFVGGSTNKSIHFVEAFKVFEQLIYMHAIYKASQWLFILLVVIQIWVINLLY
jgi:hypothetical protein